MLSTLGNGGVVATGLKPFGELPEEGPVFLFARQPRCRDRDVLVWNPLVVSTPSKTSTRKQAGNMICLNFNLYEMLDPYPLREG